MKFLCAAYINPKFLLHGISKQMLEQGNTSIIRIRAGLVSHNRKATPNAAFRMAGVAWISRQANIVNRAGVAAALRLHIRLRLSEDDLRQMV